MRPRFILPAALVAALLVTPAWAAAAPRTWDLATYTPPDGFTVDESGTDHVLITRVGTRSYCLIGIFTSATASGDLDASFASQWTNIADRAVDPVDAPAPAHGDIGAAHAAFGGAMSTTQGKPVLAMLTTIDAGASVVSVLVLTPGPDDFKVYTPQIQALLKSLVIRRIEPAAPAAPSSPPGPPAADGKPSITAPTSPLTLADLAGEWRTDDQAITHYMNATTGTFAGFDAIQYAWKLTITAKGVVDTEFHAVQTNSASATAYAEKHHAQITVKPDGVIHVHVKAGEGNDWDYLIRGEWVGPDVTILKVAGPYFKIGIPDDVRQNPSYGVVEYWVRKNKPSK